MSTPLAPTITEETQIAVRELPADLDTPVSVYLKLAGKGPSFLLESVTGGEQVARYSFIGVRPRRAYLVRGQEMTVENLAESGAPGTQVRAAATPLQGLREAMQSLPAYQPGTGSAAGLPRFSGGLVGYLGYDSVRFIEKTVALTPHPILPDAIFLQADTLVAFDHATNQMLLIVRGSHAQARLDELQARLSQPMPLAGAHKQSSTNGHKNTSQSNLTRLEYMQAVLKAKQHIQAGDIFQVVLSQRLSRETHARAFDIYRALRRLNPSPYMFFFDFTGLSSLGGEPLRLIGASPELHVRLDGRQAAMHPLAGTRRRGATAEEDDALSAELLADPKELAEHTMLVDLARNDLGRVCRYGSVQVTRRMAVERYSHVMHIVSNVTGELQPGLDAFDLMEATFPAGTVSGAPKVRAMQIIHDLEGQPRGTYAGAVGYFSYDGSMDTCITIRTLLMQGSTVSVQAGAGIVADSVPESEYQETLNKARALLVAVEKAESAE